MKKIALLLSVVLLTGNLIAKDVTPTAKNATGGPDATYGYSWIDNSEAGLTYAWQDISSGNTNLLPEPYPGSPIPGYNTYVTGPIALGFEFPGLIGTTFSEFKYDIDGKIVLTNGTQSMELVFCGADLKMNEAYNGVGKAALFYKEFPYYAIIQMNHITNWETNSEDGNFQVVLYKNGNIEYRYNYVYAPQDDINQGYVGLKLLGNYGNEELKIRDFVPYNGVPVLPSIIASNNSVLFTYTPTGPAVPISVYSILGLFLIIGLVTVYRIYR